MRTKSKKDRRIKHSQFSFWNFLVYFIFACFVVTTSFMIFTDNIDNGRTLVIAGEQIPSKIWKTVGSLLILCLFFSLFETVKKNFYVKIPVNKILDATHRITSGDFSVRIENDSIFKFGDEFDVIIEDFNKMAEELSTIETMKTDFISNVSHEFKTPLSVIHNYAVILQQEDISEEKRIEYAKRLEQTSKNMSELISNILKLSNLENQQIFPAVESYDLSEQLRNCILKFEDDWERKNIEIITEFDDRLIIESEKELLELVWSNLISNAVKFNRENGKIIVKAERQKGSVRVSVSDTGRGMSNRTGIHIFEKFYQGDTSHAVQGNGLGLALVKRVMDILGAEIVVSSRVDEGSDFIVIIPEY